MPRIACSAFRAMLRRAAELARLELAPGLGLAVHFVGPRAMAALNERFVGHSGPTDVITFDYRGDADIFNEDAEELAGEIFVCPDIAVREASARGLDLPGELALYVAHGLLHLAGEDDLSPGPRRRMRSMERLVMSGLRREFDLAAVFVAPKGA